MKILSGITATAMTLTALMLGSTASLGQDDCESSGNHTIQVREGDDGRPVLTYHGGSAEEVHVCLGDLVKWVLTGPNRQYFVEFFSGEGAPFEGETRRGSNGNVVKVTIGGPAEREGEYDYGVEFEDGGGMDPRIVVD